MPIKAESADGVIHEFPDETAPDVVDKAMKQYATGAGKKQETGIGPVLGRIATWPGRIAGTVGEALMEGPKMMGQAYRGEIDPMSPETIGRSLDVATTFSPAAPAAGTAKMIARSAIPAKVAAPTREELFEAAGEGYKNLKAQNVPLQKDVVEGLSKDLSESLNNEQFYKEDQPRTFRAIERLKNPVGENSSAAEVYAARTALNHVIADFPTGSEGAAARMAMQRIDEYLSNVPGFSETAQAARGNYRAAKQSERVGEAEERGRLNAATSGSGANVANALRQRIKAILVNPKVQKTPEEAQLMEAIAKGDRIENIARLFSKLGPSHPLSGWGSAIGADLAGGSGLATATLGIGAIAQWIAERGPAQKIGKLDELIRQTSPLGRERAAAAPPPVPRSPAAAPPSGSFVMPAATLMLPGAGSVLAQPSGP
jgi:hypothetical protein